ncbi:MAG: hypothetical protein Q9162_002755 [Coniocarpon cinnabarinum]
MDSSETEVDVGQLTEDQQSALDQFTAVTAQDFAAAIPLLRKCQWNVQIAIARFFDGEPEPEPEPVAPPPQPSRRQETLAHGFNDVRHRPRPRLEPAPRVVGQPENHMSPRPPLLLSAILTPFNIALGLVSRLFGIFTYFFPPLANVLAQLARRPPSTLHRSTSRRNPLSPYETAVRFQREFTQAYGEHPLPLMECSYARAYDMAKADFKFLLVIPLSPEHADTDGFVRSILLSEATVDFLTNADNNVYLWVGSVADSEPYQVASVLTITEFPSAVLIANTGSSSSPSMSVVARVLRPRTAQELVRTLQAAETQHADTLAQSRASRSEQQATRTLRDEQNSAYERSLAADREKARAKRAAEEEKRQQLQAEQTAKQRAEQHARDFAAWKAWRASVLPLEPPQGTKDSVRTSIRLLDGEKVTRRFGAEASLEDVYAFVECFQEVQQQHDEPSNEKPITKPDGFRHRYGFQLVSPMPREVYDLASGGTAASRLGRSANLIAERIEEED